MGTNYYAILEEKEHDCPTCSRPGYMEIIRWHIGKSSLGWCFSLHVGSPNEPHIPRSLTEWKEVWSKSLRIVDEYGREITPDDMLRIVTQRQGIEPPVREKHLDLGWYRSNHAQPGPNHLARHVLDTHCVGHGEGTWDLITGEFS